MTSSAPQGQSFTSRIAMWSARHRKAVAIGWVLVVIAALAACSGIGANTDISQTAPGEAGEAADVFEERFGEEEDIAQEIIVFSHPSLTVDDPAYEDTVTGLLRELEGLVAEETLVIGGTTVVTDTRIVGDTTSHYNTILPEELGGGLLPREDSPFVAQNETGGDVTFALVEIEGEIEDAVDDIDIVLDAVDRAAEEAEGFDIFIGGDVSLQKQLTDIIDEDFARAGIINLPITFGILILAFGALVAAAVPLALAFAAIIVAMGALAIISQVFPLAEVYQQVVLLIGLATGIDYSLFVITRYRRERSAGRSKEEALQVATGTSGKAIFFAGATTVFAVAGMFLVGDSTFSSLGLASIVVVLFAVFSAMTLLPAIIAMMGDNLNRLSIPFLGRGQERGEGVWGFIVDRVLARPIIPAVVVIAVLIAIAAPTLTLNLGFNGPRSFSDDAEAKKALIALEESFTLGLVQPAIVVVDAGEKQNVFAEEIRDSTAALLGLVGEDLVSEDNPEALYGAVAREPEFSDAGDTALLFIPVNGDSGEERAIDAVNELRDELIPAAFEDSSADALVTGATAANIDFRENIINRAPIVFAFVLGLAFIILLLTFRSVVIAVTAIVLNLFSVFAAYGLLVLVFQEGWLLEGVLDFEATGIIESWLPLFLFSLLFGLSIDYEMFVMARIKEKYEQGLSTDEAIAQGMKETAGVITNAAAIMVAVALIFAFTRDIGLKQFGFGLAAAIAIDATIIRAFVLPTTMKLLGKWNWYLPSWLEWLPKIPMSEEVGPAVGTADGGGD
ncbi:MAG: MMPL family transporter [Chloroflexi bacterium]|nr:MMPL family transporter [Chloroflexota bacterium]